MERILCLLLLLIPSFFLCMGCMDEEREALLLFKESLADEHNLLGDWKDDGNCCRWAGVGCSDATGHVVEINFRALDIGDCGFDDDRCSIQSNQLDHSLSSLKYLEYLDLWCGCFNRTTIPRFIGSLVALKHLDLSGTDFTGNIPPQLGNLTHLQYLDLSGTDFTGNIPPQLGNLTNLQYLDLSGANFTGNIPDTLGSLAQLEFLDLSDNSFQGSIPESLSSMFNLRTLELINSNLSGLVSDAHFVNMTKLEDLLLSYNHLALNLSSDPPFQLKTIDLASCRLGPRFPLWLRTQRRIRYLDVSDAKISDVIPNWFWTTSSEAIHLNLSNNILRGEVPRSLHFLSVISIDLSLNQLQGQLPYLNSSVEVILLHQNSFSGDLQPILNEEMRHLKAVMLSRNNLRGEIPSAICSLQWLVVVHIAENNLSGQLPRCQISGPLSQITCVILASNNLHGSVPRWLAAQSLKYLDMHDNSIQGEIPSFLKNCAGLVIFDLGENKLTGKLPSWIGERLSSLRFLRLRSNMLSGTIPHQMSYLSSLQVLDLAQNNLSGRIPPSLKNFTAMANATKAMENTVIFDRSAVISKSADVSFPVVVKGRKEDYTTTLSLVVVFDLSCNRFSGEIPVETMDLVGLQSLNLSGNQLTGSIPNNVGRMAHLETLDLSSNHLIGAIPTGITLLSSLSSLNLSYNNLSGAIPSGKQLQTLTDTSIYAGNPDLCGSPLPVKCPADEPPQQSPRAGVETRIDDSDMFELYLGMGVGYVVGLWGTCALFLINKSWRIAYFCFFDDVADKLFAAKERLRRWMCPRLQG